MTKQLDDEKPSDQACTSLRPASLLPFAVCAAVSMDRTNLVNVGLEDGVAGEELIRSVALSMSLHERGELEGGQTDGQDEQQGAVVSGRVGSQRGQRAVGRSRLHRIHCVAAVAVCCLLF